MGKGFNNYMTKKFFHPASKDNIKRKWMAEQKTAYEKKQQEELLAQYQKEQEVLSNRALIGDVKAKLGLSFLYDAPPGLKKKEDADGPQQEVKFEWQRKYNAPREAYAKDDDTIRDQPFGIEVRNVRCIKCRQWGHVNTDKICPLYGRNLTAEPELPEASSSSLLDSLKQDGFTLKNSVLNKIMESEPSEQHKLLSQEDDDDPEVKFLKSLTPKQKKKLLKKLNKLQSSSEKGVSKKGKGKKKKSKEADSDSSDVEAKKSKKSKKHKKQSRSPSQSDSDDERRSRKRDRDSEKQGHRDRRSASRESDQQMQRNSHRDVRRKHKRRDSSSSQSDGPSHSHSNVQRRAEREDRGSGRKRSGSREDRRREIRDRSESREDRRRERRDRSRSRDRYQRRDKS